MRPLYLFFITFFIEPLVVHSATGLVPCDELFAKLHPTNRNQKEALLREKEKIKAQNKKIKEELIERQLLSKENKKMASLFEKNFPTRLNNIPRGRNAGKTVFLLSNKEIDTFVKEFDKLLTVEASKFPEVKLVKNDFLVWLKEKLKTNGKDSPLSQTKINYYLKENLTLGDFFWDNFVIFAKENPKAFSSIDSPSWGSISPKFIFKFSDAIKRGAKRTGGIFIASMVGGTTVSLFQGLVNFKPDDTQKVGETIAQKITGLFDSFPGGKEEFNKAISELKNLRTEIQNIDFSKEKELSLNLFTEKEKNLGTFLVKFKSIFDRIEKDRIENKKKALKSFRGNILDAKSLAYKTLNDDAPETEKALKKEAEQMLARELSEWKLFQLIENNPSEDAAINDFFQLNLKQYHMQLDLNLYKNAYIEELNSYITKLEAYDKGGEKK